jgi:hypothetical protein
VNFTFIVDKRVPRQHPFTIRGAMIPNMVLVALVPSVSPLGRCQQLLHCHRSQKTCMKNGVSHKSMGYANLEFQDNKYLSMVLHLALSDNTVLLSVIHSNSTMRYMKSRKRSITREFEEHNRLQRSKDVVFLRSRAVGCVDKVRCGEKCIITTLHCIDENALRATRTNNIISRASSTGKRTTTRTSTTWHKI